MPLIIETPRRARVLLLALLLATAPLTLPSAAFAEVRTSDKVLGAPAQERGIDAEELPDITAKHALVLSEDGTEYFERDADAPIKIASVTKVMTALIALENSRPTDIITVDHAAATVGESCVGLEEGDQLTMEEALTGLMVMSGNDTAVAIATTVGKTLDPASTDPYGTFIAAMNERAQELGCTNTAYENPHGLDFDRFEGGMHSTAREALMIYIAAMENEQFRTLNSSDRTEIIVTSKDGSERTIELLTRNAIRGKEGNVGGKTGSTYEAGDCFVCTFDREVGGTIYLAIFNAPSSEERFRDTLTLANWFYGHLARLPFANSTRTLGEVPIVGEAPCTDWTDKTARVTVKTAGATTEPVFSLAGEIEQEVKLNGLRGAVEKGDVAGSIAYLQDGKAMGKIELVAAESVAGTNPFEWIMVQFDRALRFFTGESCVAESAVFNEAPDPLAFDTWNATA